MYEVIKFYEQQGWVKGAKFKYSHTYDTVLTVKNIFFRNGKVCIHHLETNVAGLSNSDSSVLFIEDCKLIKKPNYPKSWEELYNLHGYVIDGGRTTMYLGFVSKNVNFNKKIFSAEKQAKSALAFAQLTQLHKAMIDEYNKVNNCDWKPNWNTCQDKYCIKRIGNDLVINKTYSEFQHLVFPNKKLAEFALKNWENLWKEYYQLDN